jgi:hypothetical protein
VWFAGLLGTAPWSARAGALKPTMIGLLEVDPRVIMPMSSTWP